MFCTVLPANGNNYPQLKEKAQTLDLQRFELFLFCFYGLLEIPKKILAGMPGLEPETDDPESSVLPITPHPSVIYLIDSRSICLKLLLPFVVLKYRSLLKLSFLSKNAS